MNDNYSIFKNWLNVCLKTNPIVSEIEAIYLGLFESDQGITLYISGSANFDEEDSDWACDLDYNPKYKYCDTIPILNDLFEVKEEMFIRIEKLYNVISEFVNKYLKENKTDLDAIKIAVGFDDGDLKIIK
jgi:hypothetical protein